MKFLLRFTTICLFSSALLGAATLPQPSAQQLPRWRGFNLLEKFIFNGKQQPYLEEDFRMISGFGFNFVRLPIDYRGYIANGDWEKFDEVALAQIDQAIAWGKQYGIHVCINLHRIPGWTVAKPAEATNLWTDPEAQRVAALHWAMFAIRYKDIPSSQLSFNLLNEPALKDGATYAAVVRILLDAIRAQDPHRLVLCDGMSWANMPVPELLPLGVGQMTRGYTPFPLTHYGASWVGDNSQWQTPQWPSYVGTNGALLSPHKGADAHHPLMITGPIAAGSTLRLTLATLSSQATLAVFDDHAEIYHQEWIAGPDKGPWAKNELDPKWKSWRAEGRVEVKIPISKDTQHLEIKTRDGDWLALHSIGITAPSSSKEATVRLENHWDQKPEPLIYQPQNNTLGVLHDRQWLQRETIAPWLDLQHKGCGIMVGEWGTFNKTPHDVTLRWAADYLANWKQAGWGWALWNFRGPFGILDSERADVSYENYHGHQLDRRFLELLQNN